jgi:hypothetical protein
MALVPDRVIAVLSETSGDPVTSLVTVLQLEPASTETLRISSEAIAALSVAVRVWDAVFVMKSVADEPVSAEMSTLLKLLVGAVVSRM